MGAQKYHKAEIAAAQLQTAILLFLSGRDRSSVITLAGAASGILEQLVRNEGKIPFVDYARSLAPGPTPPRGTASRLINDTLGINPHKHMTADCADTLEIDLDSCAEHAITKAVGDYVTLNGQEHAFVKAFLGWSWTNRNGPQVMEEYNKLPEKMRYGRANLPKT
jgi:hypothetical protein